MEKNLFAEIFGATQNVGGRENVYRKEVYNNLLQSERKIFRRVARKKLDTFLSKYLSSRKNPEALKSLASEWKQYAARVYENANIIYAGTEERQKSLCAEFVEAMANASAPAKTPAKKPTSNKKAVKKEAAKKEADKKTEEITNNVTA